MNVFSRLFGTKYDDEKIVLEVERAIREDPVINHAGAIDVWSEDGIVHLVGQVTSGRERERVEELVRSTLTGSGLDYSRIESELTTL